MHVVGHEAVGPDGHAGLARLLGQQIAVDFVIAILEKDGLLPVAALRYMVGQTWDDEAGEARHPANIAGTRRGSIGMPSPYS